MAITSPARSKAATSASYPSEGGVERLGVDHPEHVRDGVMRRNRMPELQEVPENAFFRPTKGGHLGAGCRAAEHRNEGGDKQLTKIVPAVPGARIRDIFEGGQDQMHGGEGLQGTGHPPESIPPSAARRAARPAKVICDSPGGWGRVIRQMLYFSDPGSLIGADPWHKSLEQCEMLRVPGTFVQIDYRPQALPDPIKGIDLTFAFSVMTHLGERNATEILRAVHGATAKKGLFIFTIRPREYWTLRTGVLGEETVAEMLRQHDENGVAFSPSSEARNAGSSDFGEASFTVEKIAALAAETGWHFGGTEWLLIDPYQLIICLYRH